jgi:hypothetical protein
MMENVNNLDQLVRLTQNVRIGTERPDADQGNLQNMANGQNFRLPNHLANWAVPGQQLFERAANTPPPAPHVSDDEQVRNFDLLRHIHRQNEKRKNW